MSKRKLKNWKTCKSNHLSKSQKTEFGEIQQKRQKRRTGNTCAEIVKNLGKKCQTCLTGHNP